MRRRLSSSRRLAEFYPYNSKREADDLKRQAAMAVRNAKISGALVPMPCVECGQKGEAHHEDYAKPLDVIWLCRFHHRRRDAELREQRLAAVRRAEAEALPVYRNRLAARSAFAALSGTRHPEQPRRTVVELNCTIALVRQATQEIAEAIDAEDISESVLARRLKCSRQMVNTQFAGGFRTLKVIAAYADALGCDVKLVLRRRDGQRVAL